MQEENYFLIENNKSTTKTLIEDIKKYDLRNEIIIEVLDNLVSRVIIEDKLSDMLLDKIKEKKIYRDDQFKFFKDPRSEKFLFRFWIEKNFTSSHNYHFSNKTEVEYKRILMKIPNSEKDLIYNNSFILNYNFENW